MKLHRIAALYIVFISAHTHTIEYLTKCMLSLLLFTVIKPFMHECKCVCVRVCQSTCALIVQLLNHVAEMHSTHHNVFIIKCTDTK